MSIPSKALFINDYTAFYKIVPKDFFIDSSLNMKEVGDDIVLIDYNDYNSNRRVLMQAENLTSDEIKRALEDSSDAVICKFETVSSESLKVGQIHQVLPNYHFLVTDVTTQIAYIIYYNQIKSIEYDGAM